MTREAYRPSVESLLLLVPSDPARAFGIAPNSVIVANEKGEGFDCYYEGGLNQPMSWHEKLTHAASRLVHKYPTVARINLPREAAAVVGRVEWDRNVGAWILAETFLRDRMVAWSGEEVANGATDEQRRLAAGRLLSTGGTKAMLAWQTAQQSGRDAIQAVLDTADA